jgi:hypothetical protein
MKKSIYLFIFLNVFFLVRSQCPSVTVSPISKTLTCSGAPVTFTASFTPATNISGVWYGPGGSVVDVTSSSPSIMQTANPGTYTFVATDLLSTCATSQTVAVLANSVIPTMSITAANGFTISCNTPAVVLQINSNSVVAPISYSWTNISTMVTTVPPSGSYTIFVPGPYKAAFTDGNMCVISQTINVSIDTLRANPTSSTTLPANSYTLNCNSPSLIATGYSNPLLSSASYSWMTPPNIIVGSNTLNINTTSVTSNPTTFTVLAKGSNGCIGRTKVLFYKDIIAPSMTVSPITQTLTCNGPCKSFTAVTSSSTNITGTWEGIGGTIVGPSVTPLIMCAKAPGTYSAQFCNLINGCCSSQTVAVVSNSVIPTMTVAPLTSNGFTINCVTACPVICMLPASTLAPTSYSWTNLSTSITVSPPSGSYTACVPGQYIGSFQDGNACVVSTTVTVFIDTLQPSPTAITNLSGNSFTLNCNTSSLVTTAITNPMLPAANYSWTTPPNIIVPSNSITIGLSNITSSTSPTTYTVLAMGANGCIGRQKILFYKNTYVPPYSMIFAPTVITCANPCVSVSATSSSTVPVTFTFTSPPPTQTSTAAGSSFCIPGTYTMVYTNPLNGCSALTTTFVPTNTIPPGTLTSGPYTIPCGSPSMNISAGTTATLSSYTYSWTGPPGSSFSNPNGNVTSVNLAGTYTVTINNITNGCSTSNFITVNSTTVLTVPITGNDTICVGDGTNLSSNVSGATSYSWNTGSATNLIYVTPSVTTVYSISVTNSVAGCSGNNSFTVTVLPCVGVGELTKEVMLTIAPNPSCGKFSVNMKGEIEKATMKVFDNTGREVFKQIIAKGKNDIDVQYLAKGMYYYTLSQNKQPFANGKLVIE